MRRVESIVIGIGEMSRRSGLTVSALRFYDGVGLLVPAYVDPCSAYRRYREDQVATARVLANLRRIGMPLEDVRRVLDATSPRAAAEVLDAHLRRLETGLADARLVLSRVRPLLDIRETTVTTVHLIGADLAAALDRVRFAVSTDAGLPALGGVLVELGGGAARLVATDRYRLAVAEAGGAVAEPEASALVPAAFLDGVRTALEDAASVLLRVTPERLDVVVAGELHSTATLEHDFPSYRALVPGPREHTVELDVPALRRALADEAGTVARLEVVDGSPVGVDPVFLLQALDAGGSDRLVLELDGPLSPLTIRPAEDDGAFSLLMPVRLDA